MLLTLLPLNTWIFGSWNILFIIWSWSISTKGSTCENRTPKRPENNSGPFVLVGFVQTRSEPISSKIVMNAIYFYKKSQTAVNLVRIVRLLTVARLLANLAAVFWIRAVTALLTVWWAILKISNDSWYVNYWRKLQKSLNQPIYLAASKRPIYLATLSQPIYLTTLNRPIHLATSNHLI